MARPRPKLARIGGPWRGRVCDGRFRRGTPRSGTSLTRSNPPCKGGIHPAQKWGTSLSLLPSRARVRTASARCATLDLRLPTNNAPSGVSLPSSTSSVSHLLEAIERAQSLAIAHGEAAIVRVHLELPKVDPWRLLGHPALDGHHVLAWYDDAADRCFLAVHILEQVSTSGATRFSFMAEYSAKLRSRCIDVAWTSEGVPNHHAPLALSGFAFADQPFKFANAR